jgi:hypothetical protein
VSRRGPEVLKNLASTPKVRPERIKSQIQGILRDAWTAVPDREPPSNLLSIT